jgi:DNA-binding transcriptional ArsR family regulator
MSLTPARAGPTINAMVNNQKKITAIFAALADPTRRRILVRLSSRGEGAVTALAKPFRISLPAVSKHLRVLEKARLIDRRRQGRVHVIRVRPAGFKQAQDWIAQFAAGWDFSFDALDELLKNQQRKERQK